MDLREFVSESISQVLAGVKDAQNRAAESGGIVNPAATGNQKFEHVGTAPDGRHVYVMRFDVAVTVTDETKGEGKATLKVASLFEAGGGGGRSVASETTSRVCFSVPVAFADDQETRQQREEKRRKSDQAISRARSDFPGRM